MIIWWLSTFVIALIGFKMWRRHVAVSEFLKINESIENKWALLPVEDKIDVLYANVGHVFLEEDRQRGPNRVARAFSILGKIPRRSLSSDQGSEIALESPIYEDVHESDLLQDLRSIFATYWQAMEDTGAFHTLWYQTQMEDLITRRKELAKIARQRLGPVEHRRKR